MTRTLTMDQARKRTLDDLLHDVASSQDTLTVTLPEGQTIEIRPVPPSLKPLIQLPGSVPDGWKEASYGE